MESIAWRADFRDGSSFEFSEYVVPPQKRLDVGHYACALLFAVRLVFDKIHTLELISQD